MTRKQQKIATRKRSQWLDVWARLRRNKVFMVSLVVIILIVLSALFANVIAPYDPGIIDSSNRFAPISFAHPMGTDGFGRDLLSRVIYGGRISLLVAVLAVILGLIVGGLMGTTAGYFGGLYETIIMRITDSNLNHTGIYLYSKGKIMIHLTFDYKTDEKCTTPGQYLKYHRTFQGLSTRELAEKVGIVPATLVLYENDRHPIKHSTAVALANALGIDRNRLLDKYTAFVDYPYSSLLKKVRQDLSLTQIQMAELIGIGQTSYSGWEREIRVPRRKEYDKILAALEKLRVNVDTYLCQSASI